MKKSMGKTFEASDFAPDSMVCPSCGAELDEAGKNCPSCNFSGEKVAKEFTFSAPPMTRLIDPLGRFDQSAELDIGERLAVLAGKFPQVRICFCVVELEKSAELREFAFWLFNACPVEDDEESKKRPWTILVVIDETASLATVASGYAIEPFVHDDDWQSLLKSLKSPLADGDLTRFAKKFIDGSVELFASAAERTNSILETMDERKGGWS